MIAQRSCLQAEACLSGESQLAPAAIQTLRCSVERAGLGAQAEQLQHFFSAKRAETVRALALAARHKGQVEYVEARNAARRFHDELETDLRVCRNLKASDRLLTLAEIYATAANAANRACNSPVAAVAVERAFGLSLLVILGGVLQSRCTKTSRTTRWWSRFALLRASY